MKIIEFLIRLVLDCILWEEQTRPRRNDDPVIAAIRRADRRAGVAILSALGFSMLWCFLWLSSQAPPDPGLASAIANFSALVRSAVGLISLVTWALALVLTLHAYTFNPDSDK